MARELARYGRVARVLRAMCSCFHTNSRFTHRQSVVAGSVYVPSVYAPSVYVPSFDRLKVGWLNGFSFITSWEGCRESRRCSRDTYPESYITKYTKIMCRPFMYRPCMYRSFMCRPFMCRPFICRPFMCREESLAASVRQARCSCFGGLVLGFGFGFGFGFDFSLDFGLGLDFWLWLWFGFGFCGGWVWVFVCHRLEFGGLGESGPLRAVYLSRHKWRGGLVN